MLGWGIGAWIILVGLILLFFQFAEIPDEDE